MASRMLPPLPPVVYTPAEFLEAFPELLVRQGPAVHSVSLTLAHGTASLPSLHECTTTTIAVVAGLYGKPSGSAPHASPDAAGAHAAPPHAPERVVYNIAARPAELTARWCCELQRAFCVAASLAPPAEARLSPGIGDESTLCPGSTVDALCEFHVWLFPFVPEMHYVRSLDGILGSQHYCVVSGVVEWTHSGAQATAAARDGHQGGAASGGAEARGSDTGEDHPAAGPSCRTGARVRTATCYVAAMVNANLPPARAREGGEGVAAVAAVDPNLNSTPAGSLVFAVLHAPGRCLATAASTAPRGKRQRGHDGTVPLAFMQSFTTHMLCPRLTLGAVDGMFDWEPRQPHPSDQAAPGGCTTAEVDDNVCGMAAIATSYRVLRRHRTPGPPPAQWGNGRVRNVVLVMDLPMVLWKELYARYGDGGRVSIADPSDEATLMHIAGLVDRALLQLAAENMDLFALCPTNTTRAAGDASAPGPVATATAAGGVMYTNDVLIRSIAESVAAIISGSRNPDFVQAAGDILFPPGRDDPCSDAGAGVVARPAAAARGRPRYSPAELRWAIEERLHRIHSGRPRQRRQS